MKMPDKKNTYCPKCKAVTEHKLKLYKKGRTRTMAAGQRAHVAKGKGYTSKIAGKVTIYKQGKRQTIMLECLKCKRKRPQTIGTRTKKILEFVKK